MGNGLNYATDARVVGGIGVALLALCRAAITRGDVETAKYPRA